MQRNIVFPEPRNTQLLAVRVDDESLLRRQKRKEVLLPDPENPAIAIILLTLL